MKITILGTGMVGQTIAGKLDSLGYEVTMATRDKTAAKERKTPNQMTGQSFADWLAQYPSVNLENYAELPEEADLYINATKGEAALEALDLVGKDRLEGKTLLDISNPLDFSNGMPPTLSVCNDDSLAETIQRTFPDTDVVKSLNTMTAAIMVNPGLVAGDHNVFVSGNDDTAKQTVVGLLRSMGWKPDNIIDLGNISTARGSEQLLPIWIRLWGKLGTPEFNFAIVQNNHKASSAS